MAAIAQWTKIEKESAVEALREAANRLDGNGQEITLDFSSVQQVDVGMVRALETLADRAEQQETKVTLRGVHVDVYKVLKLVKLSSRFAFE